MSQVDLPTFEDVLAASGRIAGMVHRTPVWTSASLDAETGAHVFFKCENLQKVGAFKARGASNAIASLDAADASRGVVTHSSGNHGAAVAYAARRRGISATIVMPSAAPAVKIDAVRAYGGEVVLCERSEREAVAKRIVAETGAAYIHPFDDARVIAGQGTAALELLDEVPDLDVLLTPVGGGGLASGTCIVAQARSPRSRVVLAEPMAVDDAFRSLRDGVRHGAVAGAETWADGLMTGLGERNFAILRRAGAEVVRVEEEALVCAARFFLERMKLVVEPSGAAVLAAIRTEPRRFAGRRVGAILTGGNTDFAWLR
jgi:threonine dehydratase